MSTSRDSVCASTRIAIVGAGPAGCVLAWRLARAGANVTLIEKSAFPRVKVCGEFVSPAATDILEQIIEPARLRALGATRVGEMAVEMRDAAGRERRAEFPMPRSAWSLSRAALDHELVSLAQQVGASVLQPASVRDVQYLDSGVRVRLATGEEISANLIVHADGSGRHDPAGPTPLREGFVGLKCHFRVPDAPTQALIRGVTIRACPGAYVGTIAVEGGLATCALVARSSLLRSFGGDQDGLLTSLWPAFDASWREGPWLSCGVARSRYIEPGHARSLRIGNAAGAVDPIGGEGIGLALWSAWTLADVLEPVIDARGSLDAAALARARARFAALYRGRLRTRLPACAVSSWALVRPGLIAALWPLVSRPRVVLAPWYRLSGKPA
jgi:2-polyprenyl-6-methoxyphenol hydroxylase-like FAD-dependent oxidoreductase